MDFSIWGPIARDDLPGLCDRVCALLRQHEPEIARCDVRSVDVDAVTVDALCRLQLAARRQGCQVRLRHASTELRELVALMGLVRRAPLLTRPSRTTGVGLVSDTVSESSLTPFWFTSRISSRGL